MAETNPWAKYIADTQAEIDNTKKNIARDQALLAAGQGDPRILNLQIQGGLDRIASLQQLIDTVYLPNYNEFNTNQLQPPASAGGVVGNANLARDNNANALRPVTGEQVVQPDGRVTSADGNAPTNARATPTTESNPTTGTNDAIKTAAQTQAVNNQSNRATAVPGSNGQPVPGSNGQPVPGTTNTGGPGAAAPGDNNTPQNPSVLINTINNLYAGSNRITTEPNVLDNYYSYTYSLSWYLVNPVDYNITIQQIRANLNGSYLLARSGGIPASGVGIPAVDVSVPQYNKTYTDPGAGPENSRNPYFSLDYYLDNLTIDVAYGNSTETAGPMSFKNISFTVTEPNGLTLPKNLYSAVKALYQGLAGANPAVINFASGVYCIAIRFYGYNEAGQLVQPIRSIPGSLDPNAVVEKFVFFTLANFEYSMTSKAVEYKITGATPDTAIGFSTDRGSIPTSAQFTGTTVKDVLVGQIQQQTASQAAGDRTRNGQPISTAPPATSNVNLASLPTGAFDGIPAGGF